MASLGEFYRENGESEFLVRVEAALTSEWLSTLEVADRAPASPSFARKGLEYLTEEGRAEKRLMGKRWKWRQAPRSS